MSAATFVHAMSRSRAIVTKVATSAGLIEPSKSSRNGCDDGVLGLVGLRRILEAVADDLRDLLQLRTEMMNVDSGRNASHECVASVASFGIERLGAPDTNVRRGKPEVARHHADDRARLSVERDAFADDGCVAAQLLPEAVTDDRDRLGACDIVAGLNRSAEHWCCAEDVEQLARDLNAGDEASRCVAILHRHVAGPVRADALKSGKLSAKKEEFFFRPPSGHPECADLVGVRVGQGIEDERACDAEDRRGAADAERRA